MYLMRSSQVKTSVVVPGYCLLRQLVVLGEEVVFCVMDNHMELYPNYGQGLRLLFSPSLRKLHQLLENFQK